MAYFQQLEERLIRSFMSGWKRRGSSFLQVGLHSYIAPEFFWDAGFEVCAIDENLNALNYALNCSGPRVEYQLGKVDYLPFDDDSFDYVFFTTYVSPRYKNMKANIRDLESKKNKSDKSSSGTLNKDKSSSDKSSSEESNKEKFFVEKKSAEKDSPKNNSPKNNSFGKIKGLYLYTENFSLRAKTKKCIQANFVKRNSEHVLDSMPTFLKDASFENLFGEPSVFSEACRVARKGVIILCKNSFSMQELPALGNTINPCSLWRRVKYMFPKGKIQITTSFMLPSSVQKKFNRIDMHSQVLLFGGIVGICVNFNAPVTTGLGVLSNATVTKELIEEPIVTSTKVRNK